MMTRIQALQANLTDDLPTLQQGDATLAVGILQQLLILEGYGTNLPVTGYFGTETQSAVINFQQGQGLTQDGAVGPDTWAALAQVNLAAATTN